LLQKTFFSLIFLQGVIYSINDAYSVRLEKKEKYGISFHVMSSVKGERRTKMRKLKTRKKPN